MKRLRFYAYLAAMVPLAVTASLMAFARQDEYIERIWGEKMKAAGVSTVHDER